MEIVKAFNSNSLHTDIVIQGTHEEPLFRASDIGEILEMSNIRVTIQNYDDTERHVSTAYTSTGPKQVTFLTEKGLYKVLFKSRKPIAEKFQNWVCEVIKELRLKGIYDLQKQLEQTKVELNQLEDNKNKEIEEKLAIQQVIEKEKVLLKEYAYSGLLTGSKIRAEDLADCYNLKIDEIWSLLAKNENTIL
jgi:prophage antirepressor-like protein